MQRLAETALFLFVIFMVILFLAWLYDRARKQIRWTVVREETDAFTEFWIAKGRQRKHIGRARVEADNYDEHLAELEAEAEDQRDRRNQAESALP
jgi:hypothetical protein